MHVGLGLHRKWLRCLLGMSQFIRVKICQKPLKTIFFYPETPKIFDVIYKICVWNGYRIVDRKEEALIKFHWHDDTFPSLCEDISFINGRCNSISKNDVAAVFEEIFDYGLQVEPTKCNEYCVKKSNLNAKHDGRIIKCPIIEGEENVVYHKLINNSINEKVVEDIRIPVIQNEIPFVYLKYRPISDRFSNENSSAKMQRTEKLLSSDEIYKILQFCKRMKLEYCEIDAGRDYPENKLYIFDVNHCPSGPPNHLSLLSRVKAIKNLAKCFDSQF